MPPDLAEDKSTLVQVMAWCRQATSHYMSQCWPRSLSPYGVTRPQWVKHADRVLCSCIAAILPKTIRSPKQFRKHIPIEFIHSYTYIVIVEIFQGQDIVGKINLICVCSLWHTVVYGNCLIFHDIYSMHISSMDKQMCNTVSTGSPGYKVSLLLR